MVGAVAMHQYIWVSYRTRIGCVWACYFVFPAWKCWVGSSKLRFGCCSTSSFRSVWKNLLRIRKFDLCHVEHDLIFFREIWIYMHVQINDSKWYMHFGPRIFQIVPIFFPSLCRENIPNHYLIEFCFALFCFVRISPSFWSLCFKTNTVWVLKG